MQPLRWYQPLICTGYKSGRLVDSHTQHVHGPSFSPTRIADSYWWPPIWMSPKSYGKLSAGLALRHLLKNEISVLGTLTS